MEEQIVIAEALKQIRDARQKLREVKVLRHEKSVHCELAEWFVEHWLGGKRAISGNQKGWDIESPNGDKIQVKAHAKAATNNSPWTKLSNHTDGVSEMIIVLFDIHYQIDEIFRIAIEDAVPLANKGREIQWNKLRKAGKSVHLDSLKTSYPFLFSV